MIIMDAEVKLRGIVRVNGVDVPGELSITRALPKVYGVGEQTARSFALVFSEKAKVFVPPASTW